MINLLIFGTGSSKDNLVTFLHPNTNVIAYVDNDKDKIGKKIGSIPIINPYEILDFDFSYIVIASQFFHEIRNQLSLIGIVQDKIISYEEFKYAVMVENHLRNNISQLDEMADCEILISGLSYAFSGIDTNYLRANGINFALPAQDLFYDYYITKGIFNAMKSIKIKYQIIGLSYYSFHYDLTKTRVSTRAAGYHAFTQMNHNLDNAKVLEFQIFKQRINEIFTQSSDSLSFDFSYQQGNLTHNKDVHFGKELSIKHSKKNFPETRNENKIILSKYLNMLDENGITPIIVVFPTSKYYYPFFSNEMRREFLEIINEMKSKYDFLFVDLFSSDLFDDSDFYDFDHLNKRGARKTTELINSLLKC